MAEWALLSATMTLRSITVSDAFLVNEKSQYYYLLCYEIKRALPVRVADVAASNTALPSDFGLPVRWTVWKQLMVLVK